MTRRPSRAAGDRVLDLVRAQPLICFLVWFFSVGQGVAFVPVVAKAHGGDLPLAPFVVASTLVGLLLPAVVITRIVEGPSGVAALLRSAAAAPVRAGWFVVALVPAPLTAVVIAWVALGVPADASAATVASALLLGLGVQTVVGLVTINLAEEVAWAGFVQARLQDRHGNLAAAVLTAPVFALQHLALAVDNAGVGAGALTLVMVLMLVAVPFRAWMGWLFTRTSSLLIVGLAHAAGNAVVGGAGLGEGLLPRLYPARSPGPVHILAFALLGVVVLLATRGRLGGRRSRPGTRVAVLPTPQGDDRTGRRLEMSRRET